MTKPTIPESRQNTGDERLDEETERVIGLLSKDQFYTPLMRKRIRELVEEARKEGYPAGYQAALRRGYVR